MLFKKNKTINLFDKYTVTLPPKLKYHMDGLPGKRVLFITDRYDTFIISFEEGMENMLSGGAKEDNMSFFEYSENGKSIKVKRTISPDNKSKGYAFFSIEMEDDGKKTELNGQMTAQDGYKWSNNIEPILIELLDCINIYIYI